MHRYMVRGRSSNDWSESGKVADWIDGQALPDRNAHRLPTSVPKTSNATVRDLPDSNRAKKVYDEVIERSVEEMEGRKEELEALRESRDGLTADQWYELRALHASLTSKIFEDPQKTFEFSGD